MTTDTTHRLPLLVRLSDMWGRGVLVGIPMAFLVVVFLLPFLVVIQISVSEMGEVFIRDIALWSDGVLSIRLNLGNYVAMARDSLYIDTYLNSLGFAAITTGICLVVAYPFAYFLARSPAERRPALLMLVMLPFWTSFLLRVYAWKMLLADAGVVNAVAMSLGLIAEPIKMMNTPFSLLLGMVYTYVPFMILPLYANLVKMDFRLLEAAYDLGASPWRAFWLVTVPLSKAGIVAGCTLVFIPALGEFVIPSLLGGAENVMIGRVVYDEMFGANNWPRAAALAVVMILMILLPLSAYYRSQNKAQELGEGVR